jgi:hypothetical protein
MLQIRWCWWVSAGSFPGRTVPAISIRSADNFDLKVILARTAVIRTKFHFSYGIIVLFEKGDFDKRPIYNKIKVKLGT